MIEVGIEEWQQLKAKISQLQQEVKILRKQNQYFKQKTHLDSSFNLEKYEGSQQNFQDHIIEDPQQQQSIEIGLEKNQQLKKHDRFLQPYTSIDMSNNQSIYGNSEGYISNPKINIPNSLENLNKSEQSIIIAQRREKSILQSSFSRSNSEISLSECLSLIQQICIFGPNSSNIDQILFQNEENQYVEPQLFHPLNSSEFKQYANYFFPKKVRVKPTQQEKHSMQANKIIFKNSKKQQSRIFIFQGAENHLKQYQSQFLVKVNPSKWLYALIIDFQDFFMKSKDNYKSQINLNSDNKRGSLLQLDLNQIPQQHDRLGITSLRNIQFETENELMYRSNYCLCVFTYFPFVTFFQNLIESLFNEVKLKRIADFSKTMQYKDSDAFYFIEQLKYSIEKIKIQLQNYPPKINNIFIIKVNEAQLSLNLGQDTIYEQLYGGWAPKILKIFERQTLYQIYCMIMLENSLFFICENKQILTFTIMLFASMLSQPFSYPYPVISCIFTDELLQTPFTSIVGINEGESWVERATEEIDLENKNLVLITDTQIRIRRDKKYVLPKSQDLLKIFSKYYKTPQSFSLKNIIFKKQVSSQSKNTQSEKDDFLSFFFNLQMYYHDKIFSYMPNKMTISKLSSSMNIQDNKLQVRNQLLDHVERSYKKSNPNYSKDQFIKEFVKSQIFSICLMEQYQIQ